MNRLKVLTIIALCFGILMIPQQALAKHRSDSTLISKKSCELQFAEKRLWIDHVLWTRSFIVSDLAQLADKADVLNRLLRNQDDIGNSIKPFYGEDAGNQLAKLLREHIELAGQVVTAAASGNVDDFNKYNELWYKNADEIAMFLSKANPNYSEKVLKDMLHKHLQLLTDLVTARLNKDWNKDIEAFDLGEDHMIMFGQYLADGIIKQFPDQFK